MFCGVELDLRHVMTEVQSRGGYNTVTDDKLWMPVCRTLGRGLHSSTSQLNLSRFGHNSPCPPV